jgi:hypothetical protein
MPSLFAQNVIAVIWDFDKTLIPGYMQEPMFRHYDVDAATFWREANGLAGRYRELGAEAVSETQYLNHILTYARHGKFPGLSNRKLREFGTELEFFPGIPELLPHLKSLVAGHSTYARHEIEVEHYVVSTGLRQIIMGSRISEHLDGVWACEFVEQVPLPGFLDGGGGTTEEMLAIAYVIDDTTKTRAVFEINKGTNVLPNIKVNSMIPPDERRVPFENMIYVADGPSDIPVFSVVNHFGGKTFAVYEEGSQRSFDQVHDLLEDGRVIAVAPADYRVGKAAEMWLSRAVRGIADRILHQREGALATRIRKPPTHIVEDAPPVEKPEEAHGSFRVPPTAVPKLVQELLERTRVTAPPVDLRTILQELNIELSPDESLSEDAVLTPMTDPAMGDPTAWMIYYNPKKSDPRRRFTIAHEVGHVLLHGASHQASLARDPGGRRSPWEREADAFAGELLMPKAFMEHAVAEHGADVATLRQLFNVSAEAMRVRLRDLRLLE